MEVLDILRRLIAFDTVSDKSNLQLIDYVRQMLEGHGCDVRLIYNSDKTKANLFGTVGPLRDGGIAFSGHTDVVPCEGQTWNSDPFQLTLNSNKLIGRGTCDMKGFLACALARLPRMLEQPLATPIHFAFSFDEEVSCLGAPLMIDQLGESLPMPSLVWVGEPTNMTILKAHKSIFTLDIEIKGLGGHSSNMANGVSAIYAANKILNHILQQQDLRLKKVALDAKTNRLASLLGDDDRFTPPYTTIHVGRIDGGHARNIIASDCTMELDIRGLPQVECSKIVEELQAWIAANVLPEMQDQHPGCDVCLIPREQVPAFSMQVNSPQSAWAARMLPSATYGSAPYVTEAGQFAAKVPAVIVCGPGDAAQAHQANEWVSASQLESALQMVDQITDACRAGVVEFTKS